MEIILHNLIDTLFWGDYRYVLLFVENLHWEIRSLEMHIRVQTPLWVHEFNSPEKEPKCHELMCWKTFHILELRLKLQSYLFLLILNWESTAQAAMNAAQCMPYYKKAYVLSCSGGNSSSVCWLIGVFCNLMEKNGGLWLQVHTILDEIVMGGQVVETNSAEVLKAVQDIWK